MSSNISPFYENDYGKLYLGDSLDIIPQLPKEYFHSCITSPPYWALRDYHTAKWEGGDASCEHKPTKNFDKEIISQKFVAPFYPIVKAVCKDCGALYMDRQLGQEPYFSQYIERLCGYFDLVWDVLRPDGTLWVNLGDTYYGGLKGSGGKSDKQDSNKGSRFNKGNKESDLQNAKDFNNNELPRKSLCLIPSRFAIAMQERGWILRNDIIWHKPNKFPESVKDRFTMDYEHLFMFSKSPIYYFEQQFEPVKESTIQRVQYPINPRMDDSVAWRGISDFYASGKAMDKTKIGRNKRSVWSINTESKRNSNHFASYPKKLVETPILASTPEGGAVLDIFFGVGTTGITAQSLGRKWCGIELNRTYCEEAIRRIEDSSKED